MDEDDKKKQFVSENENQNNQENKSKSVLFLSSKNISDSSPSKIENNKDNNKFVKIRKTFHFKVRRENKYHKKEGEDKKVNEGRWNKKEHDKFLDGIIKYGTKWKKVQLLIGTRSPVQVRSHAQKFLQKMKNCKDPDLGIDFTLKSISSIKDMLNQIKSLKLDTDAKTLFRFLSDKLDNKKTKSKVIPKSNKNLVNSGKNPDVVNNNQEQEVKKDSASNLELKNPIINSSNDLFDKKKLEEGNQLLNSILNLNIEKGKSAEILEALFNHFNQMLNLTQQSFYNLLLYNNYASGSNKNPFDNILSLSKLLNTNNYVSQFPLINEYLNSVNTQTLINHYNNVIFNNKFINNVNLGKDFPDLKEKNNFYNFINNKSNSNLNNEKNTITKINFNINPINPENSVSNQKISNNCANDAEKKDNNQDDNKDDNKNDENDIERKQ